VAFGVSIPVAFLTPAAYALWFAVPMLWPAVVRTRQRILARRAGQSGAQDAAAAR